MQADKPGDPAADATAVYAATDEGVWVWDSATTTTSPETTTTSPSVTTTTLPVTAGGERCGNCADDNADGRIDFEDPACCADETELTVRTVRVSQKRKVRLVATVPLALHPRAADTTVQFRGTTGELVCATVPANLWTKKQRRFRFAGAGGPLGTLV